MSAVKQLEEALAAGWDRDTLAVYADHLQSIGDPRGELIALDLEIEAHGSSPELTNRRTSLLYAWLGDLVPGDSPHRSWVGDSMRLGFVEDLRIDAEDPDPHSRLEAILQSPAGPYIRGVTLHNMRMDVVRTFEALAGSRHPWLTRLAIKWHDFGPAPSYELTKAIIAAMPRLEVLEVMSDRTLMAFPHSGVRRLVLSGTRAIWQLFEHRDGVDLQQPDDWGLPGGGAGLDAVTELDLRFDGPGHVELGPYDQRSFEEEPDELPADDDSPPQLLLPSLRRVDLSRNSPLHRPEVFAYLHDLARTHPRLTHLRLPSIASDDEFELVAAAAGRLPALVEIELAGSSHYHVPDLEHPTARLLRPPPWPWPRADEVRDAEHIEIAVAGGHGEEVQIAPAARGMEWRFDHMPADARDAWSALWTLISGLHGEARFPATALLRALEEYPNLLEGGWREVRDELRARRPFTPGATISIRRA